MDQDPTPRVQTLCFSSSCRNTTNSGFGTIPLYPSKSKYNPADVLTRGIAPRDLEGWLLGPLFLKLAETEWPQFQDNDQNSHQEQQQTLKEMKTATKQKQIDKGDTGSLCSRRKGGQLYLLLPIAMMLNIHKDRQSPSLFASLRWSYKTQGCIQRISDSPGSQAFIIQGSRLMVAN